MNDKGKVRRYENKSGIIEAIQYTGENYDEVSLFVDHKLSCFASILPDSKTIMIATGGNYVTVFQGDYIAKNRYGGFEIYKQETFEDAFITIDDVKKQSPLCELCDNHNIRISAKVINEFGWDENEFYFSSEPGVGLMFCPNCGKYLNEINIERNKQKQERKEILPVDLYKECVARGIKAEKHKKRGYYIHLLGQNDFAKSESSPQKLDKSLNELIIDNEKRLISEAILRYKMGKEEINFHELDAKISKAVYEFVMEEI